MPLFGNGRAGQLTMRPRISPAEKLIEQRWICAVEDESDEK
jgi:hypothetical protein